MSGFIAYQTLDHPAMDHTHREFIALVDAVIEADSGRFAESFARLLAHTEQHFAEELMLMQVSGFPMLAEHVADHSRVLGDLKALAVKVAQGRSRLARAYVQQQLPEWFSGHILTMDRALATHLARAQG